METIDKFKNKSCFLIGAGGSGMSSLGHLLLDYGLKVSGQDLKRNIVIHELEKKGFIFVEDLMNLNVDFAIYSSAINKRTNEIFLYFKEKNIPTYHRSEIMHAIFNLKKSISVAGSHGKTSTTTMVAQILLKSNYDPTIMIGGETSLLNGIGGRYGHGDWGVYESDESDGTFLNHNADIKILTNIDNDHLDFYKNEESLKEAFKDYLLYNPSNTISCLDDLGISNLIKNYKIYLNNIFYSCNLYYNIPLVTYKIYNNKLNFNFNSIDYELSLPIKGDHFLKNALSAIIACERVGISVENSISILKDFSGVKRRMEFKGIYKDIEFYDDYGHHPTEIEAVCNALQNEDSKRVIVLFQPHRFTRTRDHFVEIAKSLSQADYVFLLPIYSAGEDEIPDITSEKIQKSLSVENKLLSGIKEEDCKQIQDFLKTGDVFLTLGAGNVYEWGEFLLKTN